MKEAFSMNAKMSLCEHCSHLGRTCCQGTDVYVTLGDMEGNIG